jgi:hypothetical protein
VFVAGLSGVGKTLLVQQLTLLALAAGRRVHLLQWDVARQAFESPAVLASHPEVDGVTHPAIRKAVGLWAREAVQRWDEEHPDPAHLLIGETPLIGGRLIELARVRSDRAEPLLGGPGTLFLVPAPSREVRRRIEDARADELANPRHEREAANAAVHLLRAHWLEVVEVATKRGLPGALNATDYDPELYAAVYVAVLAGRANQVLPVAEWLPVAGSAYELGSASADLVPNGDEVARTIGQVDAMPQGELHREVADWARG